MLLILCSACTHARPTPPPTALPSPAARATRVAVATATPKESSEPSLAALLATADFQALALIRDLDFETSTESLVVSAQLDDGSGASCIKNANDLRCIAFAGYTPHHVTEALRKGDRPTIAVPAWAQRALEIADAASDVSEIDVFLGEGGPVLMISALDGAWFAVRRERRWRLSTSTHSGGKSAKPFYFGSVDMSRATGGSSIGLIVGSYTKESCVRSEIVELVVMRITADELTDLGRFVIGRGVWIAREPGRAPFDPKDPNHYRIQLRPRVQHDGRIRLELESKHTPKAVAKRRRVCGLELSFEDVDVLNGWIGHHRLNRLFELDRAGDEE